MDMKADIQPSAELAAFAAGLDYDDLPASTREFARNWFVDSIASALASDLSDETRRYAQFARAAGGAGEASVFGTNDRLSLIGASLINAYQITAVTVCDTYVPAHVHIGPEIIPPALAIAERDGANGRSLLTAIAAGAEVAVRVAAGIDYEVAGPMGWHFPGIVGPFGAAAAVGRLRGLTPLQMRNAFGLAGSQAAGTWASWGTPTVKFHQSRGAVSGLLAGLLAEQDFTSSSEILTHPDGGMLAAYSDGGRPDAILDGIAERYELERISLRLWPGGTPLQPTLTAVFDLITAERPVFSEIEEVRVSVARSVYDDHVRFAAPKGTFELLLSFPFTVASALRDGRFWLDSIGPDRAANPELNQFMKERVELVADAGLTREQSALDVRMKDGRTLGARAGAAKGTPGNPASLDDVQDKYARCAAGRYSDADAGELLDLLTRIDELESLERVLELLRAAGPRPGG
jgi:2-methylcitrate dehydratase PrpD